MLILIIIGLLGLIFGLSLIIYFTSKDIIDDPKEYDKLDAGSSDKETQQDSTEHELLVKLQQTQLEYIPVIHTSRFRLDITAVFYTEDGKRFKTEMKWKDNISPLDNYTLAILTLLESVKKETGISYTPTTYLIHNRTGITYNLIEVKD